MSDEGRRPLLLIVEDEEGIAEMIELLVEPLDVEVLRCENGRSAIAALAEGRRPALMLVDLVMPGMDGFAVVEEVRRRRELDETPVIVLSAMSDKSSLRRAYALGATDFIAKPFNLDLFHVRIAHFLRAARLAEQLRAREQASRNLAHEVRNPLAAVAAAAQVIARDDLDAEARKKLARTIESEALRAAALVREFVERHPASPPLIGVDVRALLDEVVEMNLLGHEARGRVCVACAPDLPRVPSDPGRLKQVVLNLLLNAVASTAEYGTIRLGATAETGWVTIAVSDDGPGIPPEMLGRIFDEGYTTRPDGHGLGLPIARRIVEELSGTLDVDSRLGQGTRFTIRLRTFVR